MYKNQENLNDYQVPKIELILLSSCDIVTASSGDVDQTWLDEWGR